MVRRIYRDRTARAAAIGSVLHQYQIVFNIFLQPIYVYIKHFEHIVTQNFTMRHVFCTHYGANTHCRYINIYIYKTDVCVSGDAVLSLRSDAFAYMQQ